MVPSLLLKHLSKIAPLLLFGLLLSLNSVAQSFVLYGTVYDKSTNKPLPFANVFINNTTSGAVSNGEGKFSIPIPGPGYIEVVASFVGYVTSYEKVMVSGNQHVKISFALEPLEKQLNEVELKSKRDKKWERQLKRFEEVFIGSYNDPLSSQTKILNPWVLDFDEGKLKGGQRYLAATCYLPLEIENTGLGYKIIYHLEGFQQTRSGFNYEGPIQFIEMDSTEAMSKTWDTNRQEVYLGSVRHMFKALINDRLKHEGFEVYTVKPEGKHHVRTKRLEVDKEFMLDTISRSKMLKPGDRIGDYKVRSQPPLEVHYFKKIWPNLVYADAYYPVSWLTFKDSTVAVSIKGAPYDPSELIIAGYMARDRVARMLPYNFTPDKSYTSFDPEPSEIAVRGIKYNALRERPYVQTDKPYYYPGETIWFKTQMLFQNPLMTDTLSRVVYVDLLNSDKAIIQSSALPIKDGVSHGQLQLPGNLTPSQYTLRSYTNWMRNFDDKDIFYRSIPVLNLYEQVQNTEARPSRIKNPDIMVSLNTEKVVYKPREKIAVQAVVTDSDGVPLMANLSVAVTDTLHVASVPSSTTLEDAYEWTYQASSAQPKSPPDYQIEYGISVSGEFRNKKKLPEQASVTIVQGEYEDYGIVETDSAGRFWASGLQFEDSAQVAFGVIDAKGRPFGSVTIDEKVPLRAPDSLPVMHLNIKETAIPQRIFVLPDEDEYTLLQEIVVEDTPIEPMSESQYGYGAGDKTFTEKDFEKNPQLTVFEFLGRNGTGRTSFQRHNWGIKAAPPLVIIDGSRYGGIYGETPWQYLESLTVDMIKSINVYTYGATIFGMTGSGGVIMIETKRTERKADETPTIFNKDGFSLYTIKGYAPARKFKAPDYSQPKESHNEPDTRSTIYWNPSLTTDSETGKAEFSFYAADTPTVYRIVVEGMTEDNTPVREVRYLTIEK
ncbi:MULTISPECIES: carboxypeptidase-like regulatory domain-containing protein [unclassified Imperialibacter]|uniref:carboxypeptidase-like regulatory domain-containing protein n=1 Tax=unclassified Imperialibacter TaxID=2629706 RepID=UPI0012543E18|nr:MULTISPECIES: carboxypeptidase-like regulatory domain-containing protein [unclassified Imperialibacter]CAD5277618.1 putative Carboxypeptidase-like protein [Imperialibacter sp. 89]CAD5299564.1 putative Carboxypeptidase-like protein [Imperialibacter sp. 75]VVT27560.1 conserved hypothetical protein [Imperialibacter sp. EC-SDR9]